MIGICRFRQSVIREFDRKVHDSLKYFNTECKYSKCKNHSPLFTSVYSKIMASCKTDTTAAKYTEVGDPDRCEEIERNSDDAQVDSREKTEGDSITTNESLIGNDVSTKTDITKYDACADGNKEETKVLSKRAMKRLAHKAVWKAKRKEKRSAMLTQNSNPGYSPEYFEASDYYFENGLRKVYPYYYTFSSYAKERWVGLHLSDLLSKEFGHNPKDLTRNVEDAIASGCVSINGVVVKSDTVLKHQDYIAHTIHRHENPVVGATLDILEEDDEVVVINKPSSIPVHPCGRYRFNSIPFILGKERGLNNLRTIYRLDKMTSGVLVMAKTAAKTREMEDDIINKLVHKEYVARVWGNFPDGVVECNEPLGVLSSEFSVHGVVPNGKPSRTIFDKLSYNGTTSVVRCQPLTGRTHQIRIHLQFLGYPIMNDPLYNESFGPNKGKGGVMERSMSEVVEYIQTNYNVGLFVTGDNPLYHKRLDEIKAEASLNLEHSKDPDSSHCQEESYDSKNEETVPSQSQSSSSEMEPESKRLKLDENNQDDTTCIHKNVSDQTLMSSDIKDIKFPEFDSKKWVPSEDCPFCRKSFRDPSPSDLVMYLHALRYRGPKWQYESPLPDWAKEDWKQSPH